MERKSQEGGDGGREPPSPTDEEEAGGDLPPQGIGALRAVIGFSEQEACQLLGDRFREEIQPLDAVGFGVSVTAVAGEAAACRFIGLRHQLQTCWLLKPTSPGNATHVESPARRRTTPNRVRHPTDRQFA